MLLICGRNLTFILTQSATLIMDEWWNDYLHKSKHHS